MAECLRVSILDEPEPQSAVAILLPMPGLRSKNLNANIGQPMTCAQQLHLPRADWCAGWRRGVADMLAMSGANR
jgi:hypothetical protein